MSGEAVKLLDRLSPNLVHVCGFVWDWTYLNTIRPSMPQGAFRGVGGHKFKSGNAAKRMDRLAPNSVHVCGFIWEWTQAKHNSPHDTPRRHFGGGGVLGGQQFKSLGNGVKRLDRLGIHFAHIMQVNLGMDTG